MTRSVKLSTVSIYWLCPFLYIYNKLYVIFILYACWYENESLNKVLCSLRVCLKISKRRYCIWWKEKSCEKLVWSNHFCKLKKQMANMFFSPVIFIYYIWYWFCIINLEGLDRLKSLNLWVSHFFCRQTKNEMM